MNRFAGKTTTSVAQSWLSGLNISNGNGGYEIYDQTASASRLMILIVIISFLICAFVIFLNGRRGPVNFFV
jgi:hypothetical protein